MEQQFKALAQEVGEFLLARHWSLVTAESCTGGLVSAAMTEIAGSSAWFDRGFVTYSNEAKVEMLGVSMLTLHAQGAVSEQTVREMLTGALTRSRANIALAISGVAGPGGGSAEKPVGTVCIGWMQRGASPDCVTRHFPGDRAAVRSQSLILALAGVMDPAARR